MAPNQPLKSPIVFSRCHHSIIASISANLFLDPPLFTVGSKLFGFCPLSACISFFFFPESTPRLLGIFFWQPCMCLCVAQCWKNCGSVEAHLLITEMLFARRRTSAFDQRSRDGDRQVRGGLRKIRPFLIHFTNFLKVMSHESNFFSVFLLVFYSRIY
ncbi:uncharacterized protein YALI1_B06089g [Yarrowia lipolytica]|uniref:Uncharacterized protein n=1 Tax=Yarrowia lipolytica TaxID=4952 RepID=A0A1D8N6G1_YARLL|nr:hypothetical protein YALI1_B06089g [Yarrowia lipolytica]